MCESSFVNNCFSIAQHIRRRNKRIYDKNEKIWGGNLPLLILSGILVCSDSSGDRLRDPIERAYRRREGKDEWLGSQMRSSVSGVSATRSSQKPQPTFNAFAQPSLNAKFEAEDQM